MKLYILCNVISIMIAKGPYLNKANPIELHLEKLEKGMSYDVSYL